MPSSQTMSYKYNADGIRTQKTFTDNAVKYLYKHDYIVDGAKVVAETITYTTYMGTNTTEVLYYYYDEAGAPTGIKYNNNVYYFQKNLQGDIIRILNTYGSIVATYTYDAWGNIIASTDTSSVSVGTKNPFRYRGYYYDTETGLYYLNSRYYDPQVGRFISADSSDVLYASSKEFTDKNLFSYCDNNPITRKDNGGAFWDTVFDVVSLAFSIADVIQNPKDPLAWLGLAGDVIDLVPFVCGVGEVVRTISTGKKVAKKVGDVYEVAGSLRDVKKFTETTSDTLTDIKKLTGSYTIKYKGNHFYDGKGGLDRALHSAMKHSTDGGSDIVSIQWRSASSTRQAFIDEYIRMCKHGGPKKLNKLSYNQIWSPGRKYYFQDTGNYFFYGKDFW